MAVGGAHPLDVAVWGMDADTTGPYSVSGTGEISTPDALFNTYTKWDMEVKFHNGIPMRFMSTKIAEPIVKKYRPEFFGDGTTFFGSKGWVSISRGGSSASNPDWLKPHQCEGSKRVLYKNRYYKAFVESVRDRSPSVAPIQDAVRSDAISHLSVLALKSGGEVVFDPVKYEIKSPATLNEQMSHAIRGSWAQS